MRGRFWRVHAPRWAHAPLSGLGVARYGGRWSPQGTAALYMSQDIATAVAEYEQELGIRPSTFCAYDVDVGGVLDLCQPEMLEALGIDPTLPLAAWKTALLIERRRPSSWGLAERFMAAGMAGVLVPSTRLKGGINLVLWRWNDDAARRVTALDPQRALLRDPSSWPANPP